MSSYIPQRVEDATIIPTLGQYEKAAADAASQGGGTSFTWEPNTIPVEDLQGVIVVYDVGVESLTSDIAIANQGINIANQPSLKTISMPNCTACYGDLSGTLSSSFGLSYLLLDSISFPELSTIGPGTNIYSINIPEFSLPKLQSADFFQIINSYIGSFELGLSTAYSLSFYGSNFPNSFKLNSLTVGDSVFFNGLDFGSAPEFNSLETITSSFVISGCDFSNAFINFPSLTQAGDFSIVNNTGFGDISGLGSLVTISGVPGNLQMRSSGVTAISGLNALESVAGSIDFYGNSGLTSVTGLQSLASIGGSVDFNACTLDTASVDHILAILVQAEKAPGVPWDNEVNLGGSNGYPGVQGTIDAKTLVDRGASVTVNSNPQIYVDYAETPSGFSASNGSLMSIAFPNATSIDYLTLDYNASLQEVDAPLLQTVNGNLVFTVNALLNTVHLESLATTDKLLVYSMPWVTLDQFPALTSTSTCFSVYSCVNLTTFGSSSFVCSGSTNIFISGNSLLTDITSYFTSMTGAGYVNMELNPLSEASVDLILSKLVSANSSTWNSVCYLTGGSAPSAQGLADLETLIARGAVVFTVPSGVDFIIPYTALTTGLSIRGMSTIETIQADDLTTVDTTDNFNFGTNVVQVAFYEGIGIAFNSSLQSISMPSLTYASVLDIYFCEACTSLSFPLLAEISSTTPGNAFLNLGPVGAVDLSGFEALANIQNGLSIGSNSLLETISGFNALDTISGQGWAYIYIGGNAILEMISGFTALSSLNSTYADGGGIYFNNNPSLKDLPSFPLLTSVDGYISSFNNGFTGIALGFSALTSTGSLAINSCENMTTISAFSSLTSLRTLNCSGNPILSNISGLLNITSVDSVSFQNCALTQAMVDGVLAMLVSATQYGSADPWHGTCDLSGGTNSAPGGPGLTSLATLVARGATVLVNND